MLVECIQRSKWKRRGRRDAETAESFHSKPENSCLLEHIPRFEDRRWKLWMVWRIRKVLRLEAKAGTLLINNAAFAFDRAIKEIARIKLNSRLRSQNVESATALRLIDVGRLS